MMPLNSKLSQIASLASGHCHSIKLKNQENIILLKYKCICSLLMDIKETINNVFFPQKHFHSTYQ